MPESSTPSIRDRLLERFESGRARPGVELAYQAVRRDMRAGGELLASALAMRLFLLLLPFTAALLAATGLVTNANAQAASDALQGLGIASTAAQSVTQATRLSNESLWLVLGGALFALVLASKTMLRALWTVHALAWSQPPTRPPRPWRGALIVIGCIVALLAILVPTPALREAYGVAVGFGAVCVAFALVVAFWVGVSRLLPHGDAPWQALLPGAILMAVGISLLHALTTFWAAAFISHYSSAYGALGSAVALLLWFYVLGRLIVAAAMFNAARWERRDAT